MQLDEFIDPRPIVLKQVAWQFDEICGRYAIEKRVTDLPIVVA
jgi:hypothetical protein